MTGYDIDGIEPGAGDSGGGGGIPPSGDITPLEDAYLPVSRVYGWSLQNTNAGLSTVYLRFGDSGVAEPYIAINLAENETVTQIFEGGIPAPDGIYSQILTGSVAGVLYTS